MGWGSSVHSMVCKLFTADIVVFASVCWELVNTSLSDVGDVDSGRPPASTCGARSVARPSLLSLIWPLFILLFQALNLFVGPGCGLL